MEIPLNEIISRIYCDCSSGNNRIQYDEHSVLIHREKNFCRLRLQIDGVMDGLSSMTSELNMPIDNWHYPLTDVLLEGSALSERDIRRRIQIILDPSSKDGILDVAQEIGSFGIQDLLYLHILEIYRRAKNFLQFFEIIEEISSIIPTLDTPEKRHNALLLMSHIFRISNSEYVKTMVNHFLRALHDMENFDRKYREKLGNFSENSSLPVFIIRLRKAKSYILDFQTSENRKSPGHPTHLWREAKHILKTLENVSETFEQLKRFSSPADARPERYLKAERLLAFLSNNLNWIFEILDELGRRVYLPTSGSVLSDHMIGFVRTIEVRQYFEDLMHELVHLLESDLPDQTREELVSAMETIHAFLDSEE